MTTLAPQGGKAEIGCSRLISCRAHARIAAMMNLRALFLLLFAFVLPAHADEVKTVPVHFAPGKSGAVIQGTIKGRQSIVYTLGAEAGQNLRVVLRAKNLATSFNLYAPGTKPGDAALAIGDSIDNRFNGILPQSGVYTIDVFLIRAAARRNETSNFTLELTVAPKVDVSAPVKNDFADGLQGGPDFWRVTAGANPIAMRSAPSAHAKIVMRFTDGAILRNLGCRMAEGTRWCQVQFPGDPAGVGWMRGDRLRESGPPKGDVLVPGTPFHATGTIPCALVKGQPTSPCRFGVIRQGPGRAAVTIFLPNGTERTIRFDNSVPSSSDAQDDARLSFARNGDLLLISINAERYEIPDAVVNGG
jgi:hypothetical protein